MRTGLRRPMWAHAGAHLLLVERLLHSHHGLMLHAHHGHPLLLLLLLRRHDHSLLLLLHHNHALLRHRWARPHLLLLLNRHSHGHLLLLQYHHARSTRRHSWPHLHPLLRRLLRLHKLWRLSALDHHLRLRHRGSSWRQIWAISFFRWLDSQSLLLFIFVVVDEHCVLA